MEKRNDFVIAYNTARNCGDASLFTTIAHWALLIAFMLIVVMCLFTKVEAAEIYNFRYRLTAEINKALDVRDYDTVLKLSQAAASLEQAGAAKEAAEMIKLQSVQIKRFDNIVRSAPAFLSGFEKFVEKHNALREGSDDWTMFQFIKLVIKAADRPLTEDEVLQGIRLK